MILFENKNSRLSILLLFWATIISACDPNSRAQKNLLGSWEGHTGKQDVFSWCVTFKEDGLLEMKTRTDLLTFEESTRILDYEITNQTGSWILLPGKRLRFDLKVTNQQRNIKKISADMKALDTNKSKYIIDSVDKNRWRYRFQDLVAGEVHWFESNRVDSCPEKFKMPVD